MSKMKIVLGSKNPVKLEALEEVIKDYEMFSGASIIAEDVFDFQKQPLTLEDTVAGAARRAILSFARCNGCSYSFGIESGFMDVKYSRTGHMELTACAVYSGNNLFALGLSPSFECPPNVIGEVLKGKDLEEACIVTGLTANSRLGEAEGIIGILTKGRVTRKDYTKQAIRMAMVQLENSKLYL